MKRRSFLLGAAAGLAALNIPLARAFPNGSKRKLVVFFNNGGWDPTYAFDPHFSESGIDTDNNGYIDEADGLSFIAADTRPAVSKYFKEYASITSILNGVEVPSISHNTCIRLAFTGKRTPDASDLPSLVAARDSTEILLPHMVLSGPRFPGSLGGGLMVPLSPVLNGTVNGDLPADYDANSSAEDAIRNYLSDEYQNFAPNRQKVAELQAQHSKRHSFPEKTPFRLSVGYPIEEQIDNLIEALKDDLCTTATLECQLPDLVVWDSHAENHMNQDLAYDASFNQLHLLIDRLYQNTDSSGAPLIDNTTVMVLSEMGRTPKLNVMNGKDHWPYTSMMLIGAGINGGQLWGKTDSSFIGQPVDPITGELSSTGSRLLTGAIHAGFLQSIGIDPSESFPNTMPFEAPFKTS